MAEFKYNKKFYGFVRTSFNILFRMYYANKIYVTKEQETPKGSLLICSNHTKLYDPPLIASFLDRRVNFMAKEELFENKVFGYLLEKCGAYPVNRQKPSKKTMEYSLGLLKNKEAVYMFPEGTRHESFQSIKDGVAWLYLKYEKDTGKKLEILPIGIKYGDWKRPFSGVYIRQGSILEIDLEENLNRKEKRAKINKEIERSIERLLQ